jgi:hypothetical protein
VRVVCAMLGCCRLPSGGIGGWLVRCRVVSSSASPLVVVPFVGSVHWLLAARLREDGCQPVFVETTGHDGYWCALAWAWQQGESFVVVEADKIPEAGLIGEMWGCASPWCVARSSMRDSTECAPYPSLSCVKFGSELMALAPGLLTEVGELDLGLGVREWSRLDLAIAGLLEGRYGVAPCWHEGLVEHRHGEARGIPAGVSSCGLPCR